MNMKVLPIHKVDTRLAASNVKKVPENHRKFKEIDSLSFRINFNSWNFQLIIWGLVMIWGLGTWFTILFDDFSSMVRVKDLLLCRTSSWIFETGWKPSSEIAKIFRHLAVITIYDNISGSPRIATHHNPSNLRFWKLHPYYNHDPDMLS